VGGRIVINATGAVTIDATSSITAEGKGYRGGAGDYNGGGYQGESSTGVGAQSTSSNGGGGGGAAYGSGNVAGGAGYGEAGTGSSGQGGAAYGTADLAILYLGSGGGGSSSSGYATGGSGGGAIRICAASISVFGSICCDGNDGVNNSGAGSGGSIYLRARTLNLGEGRVTALGGANHPGGDGRIRLDYNTLTGQTDPVPGFTLFMAEGSANFYGNNHTHKAEDISSGVFPISRGGTGQTAKTAAFDALAPTTTKGDLIVFNGVDNVREPVGSDNQVLIADSAQETGVKWGNLPAHNSAHQSGGADAIKLDNLAAPADNTDLDATSSAHGLCPKLSGTSTQYLSGTGQWTTPSGSGGGTPGGTDGQVQYNDDGDFGGLAEGTAGQVLTSNGAGVAPSFQNPSRSIAYNYPMILEKTLDYLFRESSYQGISVGGEIIELVCLPKHGIITTAGTNVSTQQIPNGYSNPTTKMPLGSNWSDTNFDGDKIVQNGFFDWSGVGDHWKTVFPYYSDRQSIAWAEGLQLILNSTTAAARGRRGAGVYNRTAGSGWGTVDGYPVAWWSSPMLNSGSVGKMTIFPCVARVIDPGDNEDISEGDLVLFIACNCEGSSAVMFSSGAASGSPPSESTACDIFAIPENCLS